MSEHDRTDQIREAKKYARKLQRQRPWSVSPAQWANVVTVLVELANHVPDVRPSERRIAKALGFHRSLVQRAFNIAEAHQHIERRVLENDGRWDGTEYRLLFVPGHDFASNSNGSTDTPVSTTSQHISRTYDRSKPLDLPQVQARTYDRSPNGFSYENKEPGHPSDDNSASAPGAAAAVQGPRGFQPQWGDTCAQCGRYREASDLDHGPKGKGWLCHDRQGCHDHQAQEAAARDEYERKRDERAAYERSPEGVAAKEAAAQAEQQRQEQREQERAALRVVLESHLHTLTAAEVSAFGYDHCGRRKVGWRDHAEAVASVLGYFDQRHDRPSLRAALKGD